MFRLVSLSLQSIQMEGRPRNMPTTTITKKYSLALNTLLQQLQQHWDQAFSLSQQQFAQENAHIMIQLLQHLQYQRGRKPDWRQIYLKNIKLCEKSKQHRALLCHFKVVASFSASDWRQETLRKLLSEELSRRHEYEKIENKPEEYFICYYSLRKQQKTRYLIEKVSKYVCINFSVISKNCEQIFNHYAKFHRDSSTRGILVFAIAYYFYFLCVQPQADIPKYCPYKMLKHLLSFQCNNIEQNNQQRWGFTYICTLFSEMLKKMKFRVLLKTENLTEEIIKLSLKLSPFDQNKNVLNIFSCLMNAEEQQNLIQLPSFSEMKFSEQYSQLDGLRYLASLHYQIGQINKKTTHIEMQFIQQNAISSIEIIISNGQLNYFKICFELLIIQIQKIFGKYGKNDASTISIRFINNIDETKSNNFIRWLPLLKLLKYLFTILNHNKKSYSIETCDFITRCLIISYLKDPSKQKLISYQRFLIDTVNQLTEEVSGQSFRFLFKQIIILSRLAIGDFEQIAYSGFYILLKQTRSYHFFYEVVDIASLFNELVEVRQQYDKEGKAKISTVYYCKIVFLLWNYILDCFDKCKILSNEVLLSKWYNQVYSGLATLGYCFNNIEDDSLTILLFQFSLCIKNNQVFRKMTAMVQKNIFKVLEHHTFVTSPCRPAMLENLLNLLKSLYNLKKNMDDKQKVYLVDFCFNLRSDLYLIFKRIQPQEDSIKRFIQVLGDQIDQLQMTILQRSADSYIQHMVHRLEDEKNVDVPLTVSIILKNLYFLIYQNKFVLNYSQQDRNILVQQSQEKGEEAEIKCVFSQAELQDVACKLKLIKQRCKQMLPLFIKQNKNRQSSIILPYFSLYKINFDYKLCNLLAQLDDLIYIAHLTGLTQHQEDILTLRLSIIFQQQGKTILFLQLSRYIMLKFFDPKISVTLKTYILRNLNLTSNQNQYNELIELFLIGKITDNVKQLGRFGHLIFILKQQPSYYINSFKDIVSYLYRFVFKYPYLVSNAQKQEILLRMTPNVENEKQKSYWLKQIWENGWVSLRLMILIGNQFIKRVLEINQLSIVKSFLRFILLILIRSGNIGEMRQSMNMALMKKNPLKLVNIVDSLRKVISSDISSTHYKQIDSIIYNKRKSLSFGVNLHKMFNLVELSFEKTGKIGRILADIFCYQIKQQFNTDCYQMMAAKSKMTIFQFDYNQQDSQLIHKLQVTDRQMQQQIKFNQELTKQMAVLIYQNYRKAEVLRDYISHFTDQVMNSYQTLTYRQNEAVDRLIASVALIFEQYNYNWKKYITNIIKVSTKELTLKDLQSKLKINQQFYSDLKSSAVKVIQNKLKKSSKCLYPVSMIFPLGQFIFNLALKDQLLVTFVKRNQFQDKMNICQSVIQNNDDMLIASKFSNTQLSNLHLYKKRKGLDRQLGKISCNVDMGIMDLDASSLTPSLIDSLINIHPNLSKFLLSQTCSIRHHLQSFLKRNQISINIDLVIKKLQQINQKLKKTRARQNIILYIHYRYISFPFEAIKSAKAFNGIYRIPSLQYLIQNQHKSTYYCLNKCKYLVNTKKDLVQTEIKFQKIKTKFEQWSGIVGRVPPFEEMIHLFRQEIFLYMGHGTGMEHISDNDLLLIKPDCLMLVFGCSSAKMITDYSQPHGCAYQILLNGCPNYLGCLWNVTDLDIDRVTQQIFACQNQANLSQLVETAKKKCNYSFINGNAVVIYGLPCYISR